MQHASCQRRCALVRSQHPAPSPLATTSTHRVGSPDSPSSRHIESHGSSPGSLRSPSSSRAAPWGPSRPRSHRQTRPGTSSSSRPGSRARGRLASVAAAGAGSASPAADDTAQGGAGGSEGAGAAAAADAGEGAGVATAHGPGHHRGKKAVGAVSFACVGGDSADADDDVDGNSPAAAAAALDEESSDGTWSVAGPDGTAGQAGGGSSGTRGVRLSKKGVGIVIAAAKNAGGWHRPYCAAPRYICVCHCAAQHCTAHKATGVPCMWTRCLGGWRTLLHWRLHKPLGSGLLRNSSSPTL